MKNIPRLAYRDASQVRPRYVERRQRFWKGRAGAAVAARVWESHSRTAVGQDGSSTRNETRRVRSEVKAYSDLSCTGFLPAGIADLPMCSLRDGR